MPLVRCASNDRHGEIVMLPERFMKQLDRLLILFISGFCLFKVVVDYGWWALAILPGCLLVGIVVFEGIARLYIERRRT